jgi:hypothetical protein
VPNLVRTFEYESLLFFVYDILGNRLLKFIFCDSLLVNICVPDRPPFFYDSATSFHSLAAAGDVRDVLRFFFAENLSGGCCYAKSRQAAAAMPRSDG